MKDNVGKRKVMLLVECEFCVNGICLEHVSEFIYLGCVLDESGTDEAEYNR